MNVVELPECHCEILFIYMRVTTPQHWSLSYCFRSVRCHVTTRGKVWNILSEKLVCSRKFTPADICMSQNLTWVIKEVKTCANDSCRIENSLSKVLLGYVIMHLPFYSVQNWILWFIMWSILCGYGTQLVIKVKAGYVASIGQRACHVTRSVVLSASSAPQLIIP